MVGSITCDIAIAGGGLSAGLIALALAQKRPDLDVRLVESSAPGGNHIWSFFDTDVEPASRWLVEPLVTHRWDGYDIAFPAHSRTLAMAYQSIDSRQFERVLRERLKPNSLINAEVIAHDQNTLHLSDQSNMTAKRVIDARGPGDLSLLDLGWQKFLGQELVIEGGHGLTRPIIMDATVPQLDGYRFVYCLPFSHTNVFVEDTYYSDSDTLDMTSWRLRISHYATLKGWKIKEIVREETGVLPVTMGGDFAAYWQSTGNGTKAGLRAGLFHPTTGYSLPDAVRLAVRLANDPFASEQDLANEAAQLWRERGFYRLLDKMLFRAAEPEQRYKVLERFYRLSPKLIGRFYAGQSTWTDKLRILSGKPPVPIGRAIRAILDFK